MLTKQDYLIAALIGFLVGVFAIPTLLNLGIRDLALLSALPPLVPFLLVFVVFVGKILSRWIGVMAQITKFAAVGFLNTSIDFGVLNLLSLATGVTAGLVVGGVNVPGFTLATINSYFWNKYWVFRHKEGGVAGDFPKFFGVALGGLLLNSAVVIGVTSVPSPFPNSGTWLNIAKALASLVALSWNFLGYKFLVFRRP